MGRHSVATLELLKGLQTMLAIMESASLDVDFHPTIRRLVRLSVAHFLLHLPRVPCC
jgi:hypothetical protein